MNKLIYKARQYFKKSTTDPRGDGSSAVSAELSSALNNRAAQLYGEDALEQRRLYERWVAKDHWRLESEAIPLVFGRDPEQSDLQDEHYRRDADALLQHARHCIEHHLTLQVLNPAEAPEHWQVSPAAFYCWASVSRVQMPEALVNLMEFVISTVKGEKDRLAGQAPDTVVSGQSDMGKSFDRQREQVLGAALAVLAEFPEQCRNRKGRINTAAITSLIIEHHATWFTDQDQMLSEAAMQDLINKWIKTLRPVVQQ